ncbi:MAG: cadmium-translocating P-type ATPase [Clostridia bacterium]|nr:cadmium-translocating P-type ATPase [Clostridia bacterium]
MNKKQKRKLAEIIVGAALLAAAFIVSKVTDIPFPFDLLLFIPAYAIAGYDVLFDAARGIFHGEFFGENTLMGVASIGAMAIGEYPEAVFVMLFYKVGELFENIAVGKSRKSIKALTAMKPTSANVEKDGKIHAVPIKEVNVGDTVVVRPGERIPVDGIVTDGESTVNTSALTGEAVPVPIVPGERALSGMINESGVLKIKVDTVFEESTVSKIVALVESSAGTKAKSEKFITKFSRFYTPSVIAAALIIAVVPTLIAGGFAGWLKRALIFLVVSCPCALVISVPLSYFAGIGNAAKRGILIKGSDHLETLAKANKFVFDKTGTITEGAFKVIKISPVGMTEEELLRLAASAESGSLHPLAKAVVAEAKRRGITFGEPERFEESAGEGVRCVVSDANITVGNARLMKEVGCGFADCKTTCIHAAKDGKYVGFIELEDLPKSGAKSAISTLKAEGATTYMLSGDRAEAAKKAADAVGIDRAEAELLPEEKTEKLREISASSEGKTVFTGDGINDAPSIAAADVGIAMGALGSDIAVECADVVLLDDDPEKVAEVYVLSKRVRKTVIQNIVFALTVKAVVLVLGALGLAYMWEAVIADVGVSVVAILNAMRLMRQK